MKRLDSLYFAIKDTLELLTDEGLTGHELEMLLRMEIEDAIQAVIADAPNLAGLEPAQIKIGKKLLSRNETIELLTEGIPHPQCIHVDKISQGLSMYLNDNLPKEFVVSKSDSCTTTVALNDSEVAHIFVDSVKIHVFHGANVKPTDLAAIQQMSLIFPIVCEFVSTMEDVKKAMESKKENISNNKNPDDDDDDDPSFDWI